MPPNTDVSPAFKIRPPGFSCKPILIIGLPSGGNWAKYLSHILIHDLLYARTSSYMKTPKDYEGKLKLLSSIDGDELVQLSRKHGGSVIWTEDDVLNQQTGEVDTDRLRQLDRGDYQAIIVDDACFVREPYITNFVTSHYKKGASVIVMAIEGIFDLSTLKRCFNVNWKRCAYTSRSIQLNKVGKDVIGEDAFPYGYKYVKSHFIVGEEQMFAEYQDPEDYDDEEDYPNGPPPPQPGSPVVTAFRDRKCVSYFGFVNPLDVDYGAILLKLCYAHSSSLTAMSSPAATTATVGMGVPKERKAEEDSPVIEPMMLKIFLWVITIALWLLLLYMLFLFTEEWKGAGRGEL